MSSSNTGTHSPDETTLDWDERLRNITKIRPIRDFCYIQLKYMGHICRLDNSELGPIWSQNAQNYLEQTRKDIRYGHNK